MNANTTSTAPFISVWLDKTSDSTDPRWIVSLDTADVAGQQDGTTETIRVFDVDDKRRAMAFARSEANRRGGLEIVVS